MYSTLVVKTVPVNLFNNVVASGMVYKMLKAVPVEGDAAAIKEEPPVVKGTCVAAVNPGEARTGAAEATDTSTILKGGAVETVELVKAVAPTVTL